MKKKNLAGITFKLYAPYAFILWPFELRTIKTRITVELLEDKVAAVVTLPSLRSSGIRDNRDNIVS